MSLVPGGTEYCLLMRNENTGGLRALYHLTSTNGVGHKICKLSQALEHMRLVGFVGLLDVG